MLRDQEVLLAAADSLKKNGIKNTPQRQVILAYLMTGRKHPSVEMIYEYVCQNGFSVSLATVYNTLELLLKRKLIVEVAPDNSGHMRYDYLGTPHYHVICVNCDKIIDVENGAYRDLENDAAQVTGYHVYNSKYEVYGLCPECQQHYQAK